MLSTFHCHIVTLEGITVNPGALQPVCQPSKVRTVRSIPTVAPLLD